MSIDEVMKFVERVSHYDPARPQDLSRLRATIEQHVAEAVAGETERCADAARKWEDDYVIEDSAPRHVDDAIRARAEKDVP